MKRWFWNLLRLGLLAGVLILSYGLGHLAGYQHALSDACTIYRDGLADGYDDAMYDWREYGSPVETDTI